MRIFLFGLTRRGINLMNLSTEPVQLVLSYLLILSFDASFMFMCAYLTIRFSMHVYDSDLSIQVCLSMLATWHSYHHSPGSSVWLPWILMSKSWSLERVDSPSCWSEWRSDSVDLRQTVQSLFLTDPLLVSRVFSHSWASFVLFIFVYLFVFSYLRLSVM